MFLQNERDLGVKNGTLGTIERVNAQSMTVQTDDDRSVRFDLKDYNRIDHGYAATIHKAQGMTVDRTHVLATPGMDAQGSYVALSRHRDGVELHYGRNDFAGQDRLVRTVSRDRAKDMALDYERGDPIRSYAGAAWDHLPRTCAAYSANGIKGIIPATGLFRQLTDKGRVSRRIAGSGVYVWRNNQSVFRKAKTPSVGW